MLHATPELDQADRGVLAEIDDFYTRFNPGGTPVRQWLGGVRKRAVAGAIRGSNSIEGYTVDLDTASAIVTGAAVPAAVPEESREAVSGYRDALSWVLQTPTMDFFRYDEMVLSALHFMMMLRFGEGVWSATEELIGRRGLDDRLVSALYAATGELRREAYQRDEDLSRDQAIRDIRRAERAGLVAAVGYGATLHYTATGELNELVEEISLSLTSPPVQPYPTD